MLAAETRVLKLVDGPLETDDGATCGENMIPVREYFLTVMSDPSALLYSALESGETEMSLKSKLFDRVGNCQTMPYPPRDT
jgi:hypothetical protein